MIMSGKCSDYEKMSSPGNKFFLNLAVTSAAIDNIDHDSIQILYARHSSTNTFMDLNLDGDWEDHQLFPRIQSIVRKHVEHIKGKEGDYTFLKSKWLRTLFTGIKNSCTASIFGDHINCSIPNIETLTLLYVTCVLKLITEIESVVLFAITGLVPKNRTTFIPFYLFSCFIWCVLYLYHIFPTISRYLLNQDCAV